MPGGWDKVSQTMRITRLAGAFVLVAVVAAGGAMTRAQEQQPVVAPDAKVEKRATGMKFAEGPVWTDADGGHLVFSDIPSNELKRWDTKNGLTTFRADSRNANGNTRDLEGRLITCEHSARRVTRTAKDGSVTTLIEKYNGARFNSPNDAVVKSDGTIWFTDPTYGLPRGEKAELAERNLFCLAGDGMIAAVVGDFDMPNGLCFSPDESKLYVADSGKPRHIRVFDVVRFQGAPNQGRPLIDWQLKDGRVFCTIDKGVPDGIRCDERGNVWSSAGDGVHVFSPDGKRVATIRVPETPANLCFGGPDGRTLFITARSSLYSIPTLVRGAGATAGPKAR